MSSADWTELTGGLGSGGTGETRHNVTYGIERPPTSGMDNHFVYGFNSTTTTRGAVALFANQAGFIPTAKGGSIRAAIQRGQSQDVINFAPFLFALAQGTSVTDVAYILGISDEDPPYIALVKGSIVDGVPAEGDQTILRRSLDPVEIGQWLHLRIDVTVNLTGEVLIDVFQNDLDAHPLGTAPSWEAIEGMDQFVDDPLGINSGSLPLLSGRLGFGFWSENLARRGFFDAIEVLRQT